MERAAEGDPWSSAVKPKIRSARPSVKCTSNQTSASTGGSGNVNSLESPVLQSPEIRLTRGYSEQFAQLIASEIVSQQQLAADAAEGVERHPSLSLSPTVCVKGLSPLGGKCGGYSFRDHLAGRVQQRCLSSPLLSAAPLLPCF